MNRRQTTLPSFLCGLLLLLAVNRRASAQPSPGALAGFQAQVSNIEGRLTRQHGASSTFLAGSISVQRLQSGEVVLEQLSPPDHPPGALLHHWRGTAFASGATAAQFERLLRDFNSYPQRFAPEVLEAHVLSGQGDRLEASMRVRQKHVLTVVLDSTYDVTFGRLDAADGYSASRSTRIYELDAHGQPLSAAAEHGFLWRLNTYWTWEQRDGGLYLQVESVSLSRAIPTGLGWALRPYVESVPRESLEFTLRSATKALNKLRSMKDSHDRDLCFRSQGASRADGNA